MIKIGPTPIQFNANNIHVDRQPMKPITMTYLADRQIIRLYCTQGDRSPLEVDFHLQTVEKVQEFVKTIIASYEHLIFLIAIQSLVLKLDGQISDFTFYSKERAEFFHTILASIFYPKHQSTWQNGETVSLTIKEDPYVENNKGRYAIFYYTGNTFEKAMNEEEELEIPPIFKKGTHIDVDDVGLQTKQNVPFQISDVDYLERNLPIPKPVVAAAPVAIVEPAPQPPAQCCIVS